MAFQLILCAVNVPLVICSSGSQVTTEERARKAYALLDGGSVLGFSWKLLPESLQYYDRQLQGSYVRAGLEAIPDHHVLLIHSFVKFLGKVIEKASFSLSLLKGTF